MGKRGWRLFWSSIFQELKVPRRFVENRFTDRRLRHLIETSYDVAIWSTFVWSTKLFSNSVCVEQMSVGEMFFGQKTWSHEATSKKSKNYEEMQKKSLNFDFFLVSSRFSFSSSKAFIFMTLKFTFLQPRRNVTKLFTCVICKLL
jgi:hypothetical protein